MSTGWWYVDRFLLPLSPWPWPLCHPLFTMLTQPEQNIHRMVQLELAGQRKKEVETGEGSTLGSFAGLRPAYW